MESSIEKLFKELREESGPPVISKEECAASLLYIFQSS